MKKVIIAILVFLALGSLTYAQVLYDNFPFDNGYNSTIRNNPGVATNIVNTSINCISGNCIQNNGAGYISYTNALVDRTQSFTIRCVVNTTPYIDTSAWRHYFSDTSETGGYEVYGFGVQLGIRYDMKPYLNHYARNYFDGDIVLNTSQRYVIVWAHNRSSTNRNILWVDGTKISTTCEGGSYCSDLIYNLSSTTTHSIAGRSADASKYRLNGTLDECKVWTGVLTDNDVKSDFNNLTALPDIPLAIISGVTQSPSNATILNIAEYGLNISADINNANTSTIFLNLRLNGTQQFINGTIQNPNITITYNSSIGNNYKWLLTENNLLGYTTNLPIDYFYSTIHFSTTLSSPNQWVKIQFLNMSYNKQLNFMEIMDNNASATISNAEYYYCNSSYISGNPTNNNNCVLFFSIADNTAYNHIHSANSKHHVMPLGVNISNGKVLGIHGTETAYILKRGTSAGVNYFWVNKTSRTSAIQYSSNNGILWTDQAYTVDAHIHTASNTDIFAYRIQANNSANINITYSAWSSDIPELPILPPIPIIYNEPLFGQIYVNNGSLLINHTQSFSLSGATILNYTYYYAVMDTTAFTFIGVNNYPTNTFNWNLFLISPNYYYIRTIVTDSNNLSSYTDSGVFYVQDRITSGSQVSLNTTGIENKLGLLTEGINMLGYILLLILNIFILAGVMLGKLDTIWSFFNGILSLILVIVLWNIVQIISYIALLLLLMNMFKMFSSSSDSEPGKVY